ncbi:carotenoid oxygenase family protein [Kovacikia minuta CCNUW1]|uniref:carotenoid oxygenase family protein n=1 Tax=Kovacikia minuta TaxID=2931930 RepID=UPI001CCC38BE|nr:carotenoid oxygenase family protein [Kovacikia minuta]UBF24085.1 carotenoid oxygenase family protein [Kovacikia minuta CCNUW1]
MLTTLQPSHPLSWPKAILPPAKEFGPTSLKVLSGAIPAGLRGSLYRNGPARLERGGQTVGHWFDGDGGILGLHFTEVGATGIYRYVQTEGYQAEEAAGRYLFSGYGMLPPGPIWNRFTKDLKNAANTSVLALPDKLLALWEGGEPHALDLDSLNTLGLDDLGGIAGLPYSAHPKRDPQTGAIFNFGVSLGKNGTLNVYRSDASGKICQKGAIALNGLPLIHDFVLAGSYLVFCISPVRLNALPLLVKLKSFSDALEWHPEKGTEVIVIDRETLTMVSRFETDPWYQWHFGNGYSLADGSVVLEMVRYEDFQTNRRLKEIITGEIQTGAIATLWQLRFDPKSGKVIEIQQILDRSCEFPVVNPNQVGQPSRFTYLNLHRKAADIRKDHFGAIARFDHQTETLTEADLGENRYPMEPIYAPDAHNPDQGWILTVVYDGNTDSSEAWIYNAAYLDNEPVCRLALPVVVPLGFHGTWKPA